MHIQKPRALCPLATSEDAAAGDRPKIGSEVSGLSQTYTRDEWGVSLEESPPFHPETWTFQSWKGHLD